MATNVTANLVNAVQESVEVKEDSSEETKQPTKIKQVDCKTSLAEGFSRLFNEESSSDITLVVGSKRYFAHKTVLSASSEYFYQMFYGAKWRESVLDEIVLHETFVCQAVFDTFIRYFYTGVVNLSPQTAPEMLTLADKYDAKVKQNCVEFMIETINKGNVDRALAWVPICNQLKAVDVLERCYIMICYNLEKAAEMPGWLSLSLQDILTILKRNDIVVPSEYNVYVAVQNWILSQTECPLETIKELLSHVQFKCISSLELIQVETSTLATAIASECTKQLLYEAFRYHAVSAESEILEAPQSTRTYTKNKLQKVQFTNKTTSITPRSSRYNNAKHYTWILSYTQTYDSAKFFVTLPRVTREETENFVFSQSPLGRKPQIRQKTNTCYIQNDIPGTVRVNVSVFLQNAQGVLNYVCGRSVDTQMPTYNFGGAKDVVTFSLHGIKCIPEECSVSFEIAKCEC